MLKKLGLVVFLNLSLALAFLTVKNWEYKEQRKLSDSRQSLILQAQRDYPVALLKEGLERPSLEQKIKNELNSWYLSYHKKIDLPESWKSSYEGLNGIDQLALLRLQDLSTSFSNKLDEMAVFMNERSWSGPASKVQEMKSITKDWSFSDLETREFKAILGAYLKDILSSDFAIDQKEKALEFASKLEQDLIEISALGTRWEQEKNWLHTLSSFSQSLGQLSEVRAKQKQSLGIPYYAMIYGLFFVLNSLLILDFNREKKSGSSTRGFLCSRQAIAKSLMKCQELLNGKTPDFKINHWESHDVLFTKQMQDSLAEVMKEFSRQKDLKPRLSLQKNQEQKVVCRINCFCPPEFSREGPKFVDSLSDHLRQLSHGLRPYSGDLQWKCFYNEKGLHKMSLDVGLPASPLS